MQMPWSDPAFRAKWGKIGGVMLLIASLAAVALVAGSCGFFPRLLPVRAGQGTPTATLSPISGQPTIEIAPVAGDAGTRITVAGRGWRPGDSTTGHRGGGGVGWTTAQCDADGVGPAAPGLRMLPGHALHVEHNARVLGHRQRGVAGGYGNVQRGSRA